VLLGWGIDWFFLLGAFGALVLWGWGGLGALVLIVGDLRAFMLVDALGTMMLLGFRFLWGLVLMIFQS
jgi:hypothetical protein